MAQYCAAMLTQKGDNGPITFMWEVNSSENPAGLGSPPAKPDNPSAEMPNTFAVIPRHSDATCYRSVAPALFPNGFLGAFDAESAANWLKCNNLREFVGVVAASYFLPAGSRIRDNSKASGDHVRLR